jgi:hypothetical protein
MRPARISSSGLAVQGPDTLLPNCEYLPEWKTGAALAAARVRVNEFLAKHSPRA